MSVNLLTLMKDIRQLSDEDKRFLFSELSEELKKQIIGYIKVFDSYEPAISEHETFMPMSSFGRSNDIFEYCYFVPFPDGKSLFDMCEEPVEFGKWCDENLI